MRNNSTLLLGLWRHVTLGVVLTAVIGSGHAATFEDVLAPLQTATEKCRPIDGVHAWSSQARSLYEKEGLAKTLNLEPVHKVYKSFECGGSKSTVYLYEYASPPEGVKAMAGIQTYIWGGRRRSGHHPEFIFTVENVVVVVSGYRPKEAANILATSHGVEP